jgi:ribosomal protein L40E
VIEDRRCPNCGALVSEDAEWCGQCFASLRRPELEPEPEPEPKPEPEPEPEPPTPGAALSDAPTATTAAASKQLAFWPCSVCGAENPIALDACATCGTPFATVMRGAASKRVDPQLARTRSMLFPGAGHAALGHSVDGVARGAVFTLALVVALFLGVTVPHSPLIVFAIAVLIAFAVGIYLLSLAETKQLSAGGGLLVPSKILLWGAVAVMFLIVAVIAVSVAGNARR